MENKDNLKVKEMLEKECGSYMLERTWKHRKGNKKEHLENTERKQEAI